MKQDSLQFMDKNNELTVSLRVNPFDSTTYLGCVARQTINLNVLAKRIRENDTGLSDYTIFNVAGQLKREMLKALCRGQAVNVLGLGTLYLTVDGTVPADSPDSVLSKKLKVHFTPSDDALQAAGGVKINLMTMPDVSPRISLVESYPRGDSGAEFVAGKAVHIRGDRLKIAGKDSGIFLCRADGTGASVQDVQIPENLIMVNRTRELEFFIPADIVSGEYRIKLVTRYVSSSWMRKSGAVSAMSDIIYIS